MRHVHIIWDDDNEAHVAEHGYDPEDIEFVIENADTNAFSHSSGRPCCFGFTPDQDYIIVIYDEIDEDTIYLITAFEVCEP